MYNMGSRGTHVKTEGVDQVAMHLSWDVQLNKTKDA